MKPVFVPNIYPAFRCIAADCRHTCCVGWEIDVDEDALSRYRSVQGSLGARLAAGIDTTADPPCFRLTPDERCPFLNDRGLCDIITELGEGALCRICADHPRFRHVQSDRVELGLGLCCEAAGTLLLGSREPFALIELPAAAAAGSSMRANGSRLPSRSVPAASQQSPSPSSTRSLCTWRKRGWSAQMRQSAPSPSSVMISQSPRSFRNGQRSSGVRRKQGGSAVVSMPAASRAPRLPCTER